ncbi:MAG: acetyl-CoA hydrolase/transferase C-terminal domain-containing protein [Myxococcota bacterium]|nr:acetyl-CoA hydrolase/transferase C-terminal domain-containing protein [Myxococcota bacterium]
MRVLSAKEAAEQVRPTDTLAVPLGPGQPSAFLHALGERESFDGLIVFTALLVDLFPLFTRPGVRLLSGFFGPVERILLEAGHDVHFVPADFRRFTGIARRLAPRVMATCATPPDSEGHLSLSLHAGATVGELHRAARDPDRLLVVEANARLPRTLGLPPEHPHRLHVDEVDVLIESDREVRTLDDLEPSDVERAIAGHARPFVRSGSTLQTGIGGIPNAVVGLLAEGEGGGDYGIHSEMFTTGLMRLHRAGKVSNQKGIYDGISIATFAFGSRELYDWLDGQEAVRFLPVEAVNTPAVVSRNRSMVSINGALAIDLAGQVAADTVGGRQYSGIGGHEDFVAGASVGEEGRSLLCIPSLARVGERRVSRIVPALPRETMVTTPRHHVDVVITEYGAAELEGRTAEERAAALLAIAHPELRAALRAGVEAPVLESSG